MIIQVIQDTTCPWCRIGKHNLDEALTQWDGEPVEVQWLPFLLDPDVNEGAKEPFKQRLMERKGMSEEQVQQMFDRVTAFGAQLGLDFHFERIKVAVNTVPSHQLMALVPAEDRSRVLDQIHIAYFERGQDIGEIDALAGIARHAGIAPATVAEIEQRLMENFLRDEVLATVQAVEQAGVTGVPFFILNNELALSGAQPPETILSAMRQVSEAGAAAPSGRG
jgi:predicted DsbA family dithiol-disulfide isomerase